MQTVIPPAVERYGDIIFQDRPGHNGDLFSRRHPRMIQLNRAKIFAPFAALVGFDERVHRKEIAYVPRHLLDADEEWELNQMLYKIHCLTANSRLARINKASVSVEQEEWYVQASGIIVSIYDSDREVVDEYIK